MDIQSMFSSLGISASGLSAERTRMGLIANNIAHAHDTDRGDGTAYRRKEAVFSTILDGQLAGGVEVSEVGEDMRTPLTRVYRPGHPQADGDGMVTMPNVDSATEMVDLMIAARSYEANLMVGKASIQMAQQALDLARS